MNKNIRIAQLTDCHLAADPERKYRGINPYQHLHAVLSKVKAMSPDLLLATGDLSEDGSRESYEALQRLLEPLRIPILALPGNHDDAHLLDEVFPGSACETPAVSEHGSWQVIRLNSCLPGRPEGRLDENTLLELEALLQCDERPRLIALHHQPVSTASPWIDKYRLLEPQAFLQLMDRYRDVKAVVFGHIHQAFHADRNGTAFLGGPSSAINSLSGAQKFTPDAAGPAFRRLELRADGSIQSNV